MDKLREFGYWILFCLTVVGGFMHWIFILCSDDVLIETEDEEWSVTFPNLFDNDDLE